jgi:hypothetical protein
MVWELGGLETSWDMGLGRAANMTRRKLLLPCHQRKGNECTMRIAPFWQRVRKRLREIGNDNPSARGRSECRPRPISPQAWNVRPKS